MKRTGGVLGDENKKHFGCLYIFLHINLNERDEKLRKFFSLKGRMC